MIRESVDVLVMGAGFAGSLTAMLLQRIGRSVALVDRSSHPRFAIGESSTPLADLTLRSLARRYDLPRLLPLCDYGSWKATYPDVVCGLKRGFSYFAHSPDEPFTTDAHHSTELLVTASRSTQAADTHWLRADVDQFFTREAMQSGITVVENADLHACGRDPWLWEGTADGEPVAIEAPFVIDATGASGVVARAVGAVEEQCNFETNSHAVYAHYEDVEPWSDLLQRRRVDTGDYPFRADAAAVHHLIEEGWMWQLPFDNGVTSVGIVLEGKPTGHTANQIWQTAIDRYPTLAEQFRDARIIAPEQSLVTTQRLQRRWRTMAGQDWVMLPGTAGFVDPLHSTGIAHSLSGVERVVRIIEQRWNQPEMSEGLAAYERELTREFHLIDRLVAACYATRHCFPVFIASAMLYFVAAITCEERRIAGEFPGFLATDDDDLRRQLLESARRLIAFRGSAIEDVEVVVADVRAAIAPWNSAGLLQPSVPNMYKYTGR